MLMMPNSPNLLALAIILLSTTPAPSAGDRSFCTDATYKQNSTYMTNLRSLARALIGDSARLHSATGAAGEGPDRVYGAVLCRADSTGADCARRLRDALGTGAHLACALRRDVAVYSELYQLRFSDHDFLSNFSNVPEWVDVTNPDPVPRAVDARFDERVTELLSALADAAARQQDRWAVGEAPWSSSPGEKDRAVYGLAQCTRDMPPDRCLSCLDGVVTERRRKIGGGKMGGAVVGARCTLRYEMDLQFCNLTCLLPRRVISGFLQAPRIQLPKAKERPCVLHHCYSLLFRGPLYTVALLAPRFLEERKKKKKELDGGAREHGRNT